ncbi:MAG: FKBP-type peptidyl-prolyl cis-trans isomerase [bacterium]
MTRSMLPRLFLVVALPATVFLASCGGDDDDATATPTKPPAATGTTVPEKTPTKPAAASATTGALTLTNPTVTASGLKYEDTVVGTGASPKTGQRVTVHYTGTLTNGTKFDSSVDRGQPFTFVIGTGTVIKGWDEGVATMKVGGKRVLYIPAALGYGSRANGPIPANSDLIFQVELLSVQ